MSADSEVLTYPNWVFSMFAFIGFLLSIIPLPWHLEAWNTGTCLFMIWTGLACLNQFINSIIWNGNVINWAPVWCDISTRFMIGSAVAIPAASLCINRRLYYIATANAVTITKSERRRAVLVDLGIGIGIPVLEMVLQYIDQGHRFNIFEDIGCYPFTYNTWVAYVVDVTWPLAIGCVSAVYCLLSIRSFNKRRAQFKELLSANNNLNSNRYFRLMCLAATEILCTIPLSWSASTPQSSGIWTREPRFLWRPVDARKNYRAAIDSVAKRVGLSTGGSFGSTLWSSTGSKSSAAPSGSLPVFVHRKVSRQRDSLDSFTDVSGVGTSFKEKSFNGASSYGAMSLADVGGALSDLEPSPTDTIAPTLPPRAVTRDEDDHDLRIEISSIRHLSVMSIPAVESTASDIPQHHIEAPSTVHRNSVDMV
ncbi:pheromone receptor [Lentinula edodes]|uniref:Pheromone receptor n=1 Tax=Lentinula edodes TaxID=5353 RepID=A0A1Q3ECA9_LENED|nr:pheromone receptor [Lentinula edodes]